jgi:alkylation response protein AidB-like acyl-CoA dehydrogenase
MATRITSPDDSALGELCAALVSLASDLDITGLWPRRQLELCARYGVHEWFLPRPAGGQGWSETDITRAYLQLGAACLTTAFVLTQRVGACRRIAGSENQELSNRLLPDLLSGASFATVGISHLTTSRRHLAKPVLAAMETPTGFLLDGYSPWVTGAAHAQHVVLGATLADGRQILVALDTSLPGVETPSPLSLVGLSASHTGELRCHQVQVSRDALLAGPVENVMSHGIGAGTGGLQTSTLAVALSHAATTFLEQAAQQREYLGEPAAHLRAECQLLVAELLSSAGGDVRCTSDDLRTRANSLVLRATQAALGAAKGSGYVVGHPTGRWCREALFFLVWSCPQSVIDANLCQLAGVD